MKMVAIKAVMAAVAKVVVTTVKVATATIKMTKAMKKTATVATKVASKFFVLHAKNITPTAISQKMKYGLNSSVYSTTSSLIVSIMPFSA